MSVRQTNEDYSAYDSAAGRGGNLTAMQIKHAELSRWAEGVLAGGQRYGCLVLGFSGYADGMKLGPERTLAAFDAVDAAWVLPLLNRVAFEKPRHWLPRYRLHFATQKATLVDDDVVFGGQSKRCDLWSADLAKRPLQSHPVFQKREYVADKVGLGDQIAEAAGQKVVRDVITAPISGRVSVVRDDLHMRVVIDGREALRFSLQDLSVQIDKVGSDVQAGDPIGRLLYDCTYLIAEFDEAQRPVMDYIGGDVLSATERKRYLAFGLAAWERMLAFEDAKQHGNVPVSATMAQCTPRQLVQAPLDVVKAELSAEAFQQVVQFGENGWYGEGVLVPFSAATEAIRSFGGGRWLDFSHMDEFYDVEEGCYITPAMPFSAKTHGFLRRANDVAYDLTPVGARFAGVEQRIEADVRVRRNRRHSRRARG